MKLINLIAPSFAVSYAVTTAGAVTIPKADTPLFHLVASSSSESHNLLSLRFASNGWGPATLLGSSSFPKWYFWQGNLVVVDPDGGSYSSRPLINAGLTATGCSKSGALSFVLGGSANKCAKYGKFQIQSFVENAQLGAKLVVDYTGGFYACGLSWDIYYKTSPSDGPDNFTTVERFPLCDFLGSYQIR